jgi:outer membrane immunogenic protein
LLSLLCWRLHRYKPRTCHFRPVPEAPAAPQWSWTGFYIGGHGGYGWGTDPFSETATGTFGSTSTTLDIKSRGWIAGGHAGYNWQYGMWVGGLEIDLDATGIKGTSSQSSGTAPFISTDRETDTFKYLGTARARVGIAAMQNILFYGTGGLAWSQFQREYVSIFAQPGSTSTSTSTGLGTLFGIAAGGGVEASLGNFGMPAILLRAEYLHYDFGDQGGSSFVVTGVNGGTSTTKLGRITVDAVRAGASVKF